MHDHGQTLQAAGRRCAVLLAALTCALAWGTAHAQGEARSFLAKGESARGRILVPVRFGDIGPYPFLLDLAIRHPVVDAKVAEFIGLPLAEVSEETVPGPVFMARALRCGGLPPQEILLAGVDLSDLGERLGRRVAGLWPAHQPGLEIAIDFANAQVTWTDIAESKLASDGNALPMTLGEDGAPRVAVELMERVNHTLTLDIVGGGRLALSEALLAELGVLRGDTPRLRILGTGIESTTQCRFPKIAVGSTQYLDIVCSAVRDTSQECIGLDLLRDFRLTLNYEFGLAGFERTAPDAAQDPPIVGYGIVLDRRRDGIWTVRVAEGSTAQRAGMCSGDALLALGSQRVVGAGYDAVASQLAAQPETILRVTYSRPGTRARSVTLKAEVLL